MGDNLTTNVHERVDQLVEPVCSARKRNDEGRAIEVFVGKVKESHNAVEKQNGVIILFYFVGGPGDRTFHEACVDQRHFRRRIM